MGKVIELVIKVVFDFTLWAVGTWAISAGLGTPFGNTAMVTAGISALWLSFRPWSRG